jgi:LysM repeat protein
MRLRNALCGLALVSSLAACGGGGSEDSGTDAGTPTTISALGSTTFRTIPVTTVPLVDVAIDPAANGGVVGGQLTTYTIVAGDYPLGIGKKLGCDWKEVATYNGILPDDFMTKKGFPDDVINVPEACTGTGIAPPGEVTPSVTQAAAVDAPAETEAPAAAGGEGYTVLADDTVYGIAKKFDVSPTALAEANGWSDGINHAIYPGDKIKLPKPA